MIPERLIPGDDEETERHMIRYAFASRYVRGKRVLDIACGTGYGTQMMFDSGAKEAIGIDCSKDAISYALDHYRGTFMQGDAEMLNIPDGIFDVVISFETIEHVDDYRKFISEVDRVLRNDGLFILSTLNVDGFYERMRQKYNKFHKSFFSADEWMKILSIRFDIIEMLGQEEKYMIFPGRGILNNMLGTKRNLGLKEWNGNQRTIILVMKKRSVNDSKGLRGGDIVGEGKRR
jgi:ubiquinone/menaquinone biosynthesis C-methylase UbiE